MIETASRSHLATPTTKSYVLTTLAKLTSRFGDEHKPRIEEMIGGFKTSMSLELQQRSCEVVVVRGAPPRLTPHSRPRRKQDREVDGSERGGHGRRPESADDDSICSGLIFADWRAPTRARGMRIHDTRLSSLVPSLFSLLLSYSPRKARRRWSSQLPHATGGRRVPAVTRRPADDAASLARGCPLAHAWTRRDAMMMMMMMIPMIAMMTMMTSTSRCSRADGTASARRCSRRCRSSRRRC